MMAYYYQRLQSLALFFGIVNYMTLSHSSFTATRATYSRISQHVFAGRPFFIKRDDENCIEGIYNSISGNKSRKLLHLTKKTIFPKVVVSYGGPQSNSMLAISKVVAAASSGESTFFYFIKPLPKFLRNTPSGNLKAALALGMQVYFSEYYNII